MCKITALLLLAIFGMTAMPVRGQGADPVTFLSLLREMSDPAVVALPPAHPYKSLQASSYNRASKTPDDPKGWFANGDSGFAIRTENTQGRREVVIMEHNGPGVLTRIWAPYFFYNFKDRKGPTIRIYLDGAETPAICANFIELITGKGIIPNPFAAYTCRAGDIYLPIPFAKSCKITLEEKAFFYIVNYRAYEPGTQVETFHADLLKTDAEALAKTGQILLNPPEFQQGKEPLLNASIAPQGKAELQLPAGPSAIRRLEFSLKAKDVPQALRSTVLEMVFDGESTVWCPLGDFFSNVNAVDPYKTWEREVRPDGTMLCRWVMPYAKTGLIRLHNLGKETVSARISARTGSWKTTANSLRYFHANWHTEGPHPARPIIDMNFIEAKGEGLHVGDSFVVLNPLPWWWGEGDDKIYVDDDFEKRFPSQHGTGAEDYYGWAGGEHPTRKDEFSSPFLANVRVGGEKGNFPENKEPYTRGYNICTRTRSLDATPFSTRFKFDIEAFNYSSSPEAWLQYAMVTFWYGAPGASSNRPPRPAEAAAPVPQIEDVAAAAKKGIKDNKYFVKDAIEAEGIREIEVTPGVRHGGQAIGFDFPSHKWSNDSHLVVQASAPGQTAVVTLLEQYQPKRVQLYLTQSSRYGTLNIYVNNRLVIKGWDGYASEPQPAAPVDLGSCAPNGNIFQIKLEVADKNPKSSGFQFALDCIVLKETP